MLGSNFQLFPSFPYPPIGYGSLPSAVPEYAHIPTLPYMPLGAYNISSSYPQHVGSQPWGESPPSRMIPAVAAYSGFPLTGTVYSSMWTSPLSTSSAYVSAPQFSTRPPVYPSSGSGMPPLAPLENSISASSNPQLINRSSPPAAPQQSEPQVERKESQSRTYQRANLSKDPLTVLKFIYEWYKVCDFPLTKIKISTDLNISYHRVDNAITMLQQKRILVFKRGAGFELLVSKEEAIALLKSLKLEHSSKAAKNDRSFPAGQFSDEPTPLLFSAKLPCLPRKLATQAKDVSINMDNETEIKTKEINKMSISSLLS